MDSSRKLSFYFNLVLIYTVLLSAFSLVCSAQNTATSLPPSQETIFNNGNGDTETSKQASELRARDAADSIRGWTLSFGRDVHLVGKEATCLAAIKDQFDPAKSDPERRGKYKATIESIDWAKQHAQIVKEISNTMGWHKRAVEAIAKASEAFASNHTYNETVCVDYVDVHRLHNLDEVEDESLVNGEAGELVQPTDGGGSTQTATTDLLDSQETARLDPSGNLVDETQSEQPEQLGTPAPLQSLLILPPGTIQKPENSSQQQQQPAGECVTPYRYLKLSKHSNFKDVLINLDESAVHVPVHIFPGAPQVMNGIAWSEELTKVFKTNMVRNPKLTNQYFASQTGFMRLFPAQKWQIPRLNPDLYDARMRPWYVAGAASRKNVIILVDSSGSMTGSRSDIAEGVVFEILDTLTDNDHFAILKFSDSVAQVGVPSCSGMRVERRASPSKIPLKNTMFVESSSSPSDGSRRHSVAGENETDIDSLYLLPATGRNVRHVKTNFTIATSGIANFSEALVTAFEVLRKYENDDSLGSQCNQAIMLVTDGSPSDFDDIFNRYNYPNAPVRIFTYLIGREANDGSHTKMMACHNRGFYTHVINLAEVRETVQQYIPVMARPLVLNRTHPITWTPAYGELTYQVLTDWIWESRRREKARAILAANKRGGGGAQYSQNGYVAPDISRVSNSADETNLNVDLLDSSQSNGGNVDFESGGETVPLEGELEAIDLFGYETNPDCFWETHQNDLLTTVVQPVYDTHNESNIVEKFLNKNLWVKKENLMRTANLLGVAAADMKINDIIALAPTYKLGSNGYAIMLTNNGLVMHHPNLRSVLEPFSYEQSERGQAARILKPFFSSLDFTQVEHILSQTADSDFIKLRKESVEGLMGRQELKTKRILDCQRRVQSRSQSFYYKPLQEFPFSFIIAIPQPYGSYRIQAQVELKNSTASLREKLTTYFTTSDYDIWTVHPDYNYCDWQSNNTITTLLDVFQRIDDGKLDDIQPKPIESAEPPLHLPGKIYCDMRLVESLVYDAVATFGFSESCGSPKPTAESNLLGRFGARFTFISTRSGLTRVRHYDADDVSIKREALAFAKKHARTVDETFYSRTVDYNMLINDSSTLIQVPFNAHKKIQDNLNRFQADLAPAFNDDDLIDSNLNQDGGTGSIKPIRHVKDMNLIEKLEILANSSTHVIATQSIVVHEGTQRAVAGVTGVFYDYSTFVLRFLNTTNSKFEQENSRPDQQPKAATCYGGNNSNEEICDSVSKSVRCGYSNDTIDCLLIDNNGYILVSEDLDYIGRHLKAYDQLILKRLVEVGVYQEINVTDYQSICVKQEEKQTVSSACQLGGRTLDTLSGAILRNLLTILIYLWTILATLSGFLFEFVTAQPASSGNNVGMSRQQQAIHQSLALIPNKTYLRPCDRVLTRYETRPGIFSSAGAPDYYSTVCNCKAWFLYEQVPNTNLIMLIVDMPSITSCRQNCDDSALAAKQQFDVDDSLNSEYNIVGTSEDQVCSMVERESKLYRKRLDACFSYHPGEEHIKLCGSAGRSAPLSNLLLLAALFCSLVKSFRN